MTAEVGGRYVLERSRFPAFLEALRARGYRVIGPTVRSGAIIYDEITKVEDLPIGWTDRSEPGRYRLERRSDEALFGFNVGPHSWKRFLFAPRERLWTATKDGESFRLVPESPPTRPMAFLGAKACELAAIDIQDRVFLGSVPDPGYRARRTGALRIGIDCSEAKPTCFCTSMKTGPAVTGSFDLALTEILEKDRHFFLVRVGTPEGADVLDGLALPAATEDDARAAAEVPKRTALQITRTMRTDDLVPVLVERPTHPRWEIVAQRCLSCANCTLACPTCFCYTTEEVPTLDGDQVERWRHWDSCFTLTFSEVHGGTIRTSTRSRYRQWLTHKLATWPTQFGTGGCVGCGRCIAWCPVGIDLTEEVAELRKIPAPEGGPA